MNSCFWIILLLACGGNCGFGRNNNRSGYRRNNCGMDDCDCMMDYGRRNTECDDNDGSDYMMDHSDDCGCMQNEYNNGMSYDRSGYYENHNEDCDYNENSMSYETFGCQENGVPCPPPVPVNYMR